MYLSAASTGAANSYSLLFKNIQIQSTQTASKMFYLRNYDMKTTVNTEMSDISFINSVVSMSNSYTI